MRVAIIDYGMGNIRSVYNAFRYLGVKPTIVANPSKLSAEKIVIPGVGAFGDGMKNLAIFLPRIKDALISKVPILGICLGLHMFFDRSDEMPGVKGSGLIRGRVVRIRTRLQLPHIGWNRIEMRKGKRACPLFKGLDGGHVYFAHSYHVIPMEDVVVATSNYGCRITAAVWKENILGTQFHPEKSGSVGLRMLENFLDM